MAPVWKLLKSKQNDDEWKPACRGALRSAIAGRQYPQTRVFAAGWSEHNRCIFCLHIIPQDDLEKGKGIPRSVDTGIRGTQVRNWCNHEGGSNTRVENSGGLHSSEVLDRPPIASAEADVSRTEQQEKAKAVVATADQISRTPVGSSNNRIWKC